MNKNERESLLRELAETLQGANEVFEDYGISAPSVDCDEDDCDIPDDHDIITLHKLLREAYIILEDYTN